MIIVMLLLLLLHAPDNVLDINHRPLHLLPDLVADPDRDHIHIFTMYNYYIYTISCII